jgi:hypothetical protein
MHPTIKGNVEYRSEQKKVQSSGSCMAIPSLLVYRSVFSLQLQPIYTNA